MASADLLKYQLRIGGCHQADEELTCQSRRAAHRKLGLLRHDPDYCVPGSRVLVRLDDEKVLSQPFRLVLLLDRPRSRDRPDVVESNEANRLLAERRA